MSAQSTDVTSSTSLDVTAILTAISAQEAAERSDVDWFRHSHRRRPIDQLSDECNPVLMTESELSSTGLDGVDMDDCDTKYLLDGQPQRPISSTISSILEGCSNPISVHSMDPHPTSAYSPSAVVTKPDDPPAKFLEMDGTYSDVSDKTDSGVSSHNGSDIINDKHDHDDNIVDSRRDQTVSSRTPLKGEISSEARRQQEDSGVVTVTMAERIPLVLWWPFTTVLHHSDSAGLKLLLLKKLCFMWYWVSDLANWHYVYLHIYVQYVVVNFCLFVVPFVRLSIFWHTGSAHKYICLGWLICLLQVCNHRCNFK